MTTTAEIYNILLEKIAKKYFEVETLETRNSDSLDFYDISVWSIRSALNDAFITGMEVGSTLNKN